MYTNLEMDESLELSLADKMLIRAYNLFYKDKFDLNDENLELKIQYMTFLLSKYGINLTPKFHEYVKYDLDKTVHSDQITDWVIRLNSKQIKELDKEVIIEWAIKKIKIISSKLEEYLKQFDDNKHLEILNNLCMVLYSAEMFIGYDFTVKSIRKNEKINFSSKEIKQHVRLIKTINTNLKQGGQL